MSMNDKKNINHEEDEQSGEGGQGGAGSAIEFRFKDAMSVQSRDDLLPPAEIDRLLLVHKELHKTLVNKQKATRKERQAMKEGRLNLTTRYEAGGAFRAGVSAGRYSPYKQHPISQKAQFSGIDRQVTLLPTENVAETNPEPRNELQHQHELQHRHQHVPRFNPKPRPY